MAEEKKVDYRRANWFELIFGMANNGNGICFYLLMMYASYIATEGYGIAVATMGIIATVCRLFDAVTDALAAFLITFIGYKTTTPQMGDEATWPLFWMSMLLSFGLPILGFACTLVSMKWYHLTKEEMQNVAQTIHNKDEASKSQNA